MQKRITSFFPSKSCDCSQYELEDALIPDHERAPRRYPSTTSPLRAHKRGEPKGLKKQTAHRRILQLLILLIVQFVPVIIRCHDSFS